MDGAGRTLEFREMVVGIHRRGLRVVLDVVYNHTFSSGTGNASGTALARGEVTEIKSELI